MKHDHCQQQGVHFTRRSRLFVGSEQGEHTCRGRRKKWQVSIVFEIFPKKNSFHRYLRFCNDVSIAVFKVFLIEHGGFKECVNLRCGKTSSVQSSSSMDVAWNPTDGKTLDKRFNFLLQLTN